jgi:hypothetical protein
VSFRANRIDVFINIILKTAKITIDPCAKTSYIYMAVAIFGAVSEWLKEAVLKTVVPQGTGGSNPPCSEKPIIARKFFGCYKLKKSQNIGGFEPEHSCKKSKAKPC